jgi:hypothetical protein
LDIDNQGGTYSRLTGFARILKESQGRWRELGETIFPDIGILPGIKLHLMEDVGRALPSGKYKVEAGLYVDGQRPRNTVSKEFDFAGDPRITIVKGEAPLELEPRDVLIETFPGATRVASLTVRNDSEDDVIVDVNLALPNLMANLAYGDVRGPDFDCAQWVEISPTRFQLRGHRRQNLRIICKMPKPAGKHPNYYATILLDAHYADGTNAGTREARLCVQDRRGERNPEIQNTLLTFAESQPGRYVVTARFSNVGNTHIMPNCRAVLTTVPGGTPMRRLNMSNATYEQTGMMLPLEIRNFRGVLDVSGVPTGVYRLTAVLTPDPGQAVQAQTTVRVGESDGNRTLEVMSPDEVDKINEGTTTRVEL